MKCRAIYISFFFKVELVRRNASTSKQCVTAIGPFIVGFYCGLVQVYIFKGSQKFPVAV